MVAQGLRGQSPSARNCVNYPGQRASLVPSRRHALPALRRTDSRGVALLWHLRPWRGSRTRAGPAWGVAQGGPGKRRRSGPTPRPCPCSSCRCPRGPVGPNRLDSAARCHPGRSRDHHDRFVRTGPGCRTGWSRAAARSPLGQGRGFGAHVARAATVGRWRGDSHLEGRPGQEIASQAPVAGAKKAHPTPVWRPRSSG